MWMLEDATASLYFLRENYDIGSQVSLGLISDGILLRVGALTKVEY
jgi:hypothetical protein